MTLELMTMLALETVPATLPTVRVDTDDVPRFLRQLLFRQRASRFADVSIQEGPEERFRVRALARTLGDIVAVSIETSSGLKLVRLPKHVKTEGGDQCAVVLFHAGGLTGEADGTVVSASPGSVLIVDRSRPNSFVIAVSRCTILLIRRDRLLALSSAGGLPHGLVVPGAAGALLADYLSSLERRLPEITLEEAPHIERGTCEMIVACIAPSQERLTRATQQLEQSWRIEVKRAVDARLHDPNLSPEMVGESLGISRSALYRLFGSEKGGVSAFIRRRRLRAACRMLTDPNERSRVSELAFACGFKSDTHFSRAFRDEFGVSPSAVRATGLEAVAQPGNDPLPLDVIQGWITRLD